jgi:hypothetical protein
MHDMAAYGGDRRGFNSIEHPLIRSDRPQRQGGRLQPGMRDSWRDDERAARAMNPVPTLSQRQTVLSSVGCRLLSAHNLLWAVTAGNEAAIAVSVWNVNSFRHGATSPTAAAVSRRKDSPNERQN